MVDAIRSANEAPDTPPAAATTQHAAGFRADCVLTGLADGKRQVLVSPTLNLKDDTEISFLYDGKPPIVVRRRTDDHNGILASLRLKQQADGTIHVMVRLSRRIADDLKSVPRDEPDAVVLAREVDLVGLEKRFAETQETLASAKREKRRRQALAAAPYAPDEIAEVDPQMAARRKGIAIMQARRNEMRIEFGDNHPKVIQMEQAISFRQKQSDRLAEEFNRKCLILREQDGTPISAIPIDLAPLIAQLATEKAALEEARSALRIALLRGGIQTDQTVKPGEPVAVELDDGTRLEVSAHPATP